MYLLSNLLKFSELNKTMLFTFLLEKSLIKDKIFSIFSISFVLSMSSKTITIFLFNFFMVSFKLSISSVIELYEKRLLIPPKNLLSKIFKIDL